MRRLLDDNKQFSLTVSTLQSYNSEQNQFLYKITESSDCILCSTLRKGIKYATAIWETSLFCNNIAIFQRDARTVKRPNDSPLEFSETQALRTTALQQWS